MQITYRQKAQETSITQNLFTVALLWPRSLMLASSHKQTLHIENEETKSCLLQIVYCSYICPAPAQQLWKSASGWKGSKNVHMATFRETEFD